jgi:ArsR family transcriptional regulator
MATNTKLSKTSQRKTESPSAPVLNFDPVIVKKVQAQMLEKKQLSAVSEFFKVLGDETRMKIINALAHEELCVSDLAAALEMTQSAVSHQLKLLRMAHQVKARREGKSIYYSLDDQHVIDILEEALIHIRHKISEAD